MSTDPPVAAVGRVEAAIGGDSSLQSPILPSPVCGEGEIREPSPVYGGGKGGCRVLIDLAAAIDCIEALIVAGTAPRPDGFAALERVADIAFVLHEREVEASLCDALDAAVREIGDACALNQAVAQRTHQAAALLRELSRRIKDMIALAVADHRAEPPAAAMSEPADSAPPGGAEPADFAVDQIAHHDIERDHETQLSRDAEQQGVVDAVERPSAHADEVRPLLEREPSWALLPESQPPVGPEEGPGGLFEPMADSPLAPPIEAVAAVVAPVVAPARPSDLASNPEHTRSPSGKSEPQCGANAQTVISAAEAEGREVSSLDTAALVLAPSAAPDGKPPQAPSSPPRGAAVPAVPRPAPSDPLAPVRSLSEEEMIALFS